MCLDVSGWLGVGLFMNGWVQAVLKSAKFSTFQKWLGPGSAEINQFLDFSGMAGTSGAGE